LDAPAWDGLRVLDFGGNWGNFLRDPGCTVLPDNYWCLDIDLHALELGRRDFRRATGTITIDGISAINPSGNRDEPVPVFQTEFDVIIAYSVFTHTSRQELIDTIRKELLPRLSLDGKCVISLLTPDRLSHFLTRYSRLTSDRISALDDQARDFKSGFYLIGRDEILSIDAKLPKHPGRLSLTSFYFAGRNDIFMAGTQHPRTARYRSFPTALVIERATQ